MTSEAFGITAVLLCGLWQLISGRCSLGFLSGVARLCYAGPVSLKVAGLKKPSDSERRAAKSGAAMQSSLCLRSAPISL